MRRTVLALSALGATGVLVGQAPPAAAQQNAGRAAAPFAVTLSRPDAEYAEPLSNVAGLRELRDGRVVVTDRLEKTIQLVDFGRNSATRIGTEGGGPNEYGIPGPLYPLPGDSTLMHDLGNNRYLVIAPTGTVARTFSTLDPGEPDMRLVASARGVDGAGNLYFLDRGLRLDRPGGGPVSGAITSPDSGEVVRYDPATKRVTTIGRVALPKVTGTASGPANQQRVMMMAIPFTAQDDWTVGVDGRIAIVRHDPYRVEWLAPNGQRVVGPTQPYRPLRVTDKDKEEFRNSRATMTGTAVRMTVDGPGGGGTRASVAPAPTTAMPLPEPSTWPEVKPPFLGNAARVASDGRLWVLRTRAAGDDVPTYDVFDSFGTLAGTVKLPAGTRVAGFGRNAVYLVRTDADDLQYLQRYRLN